MRLESVEAVDAVVVHPTQVLDLCAGHRVSGLVVSSPVLDRRVRVRVYTTSLRGAEDSATGGAVVGVGIIESLDGITGDIVATQGPHDLAKQGRLGLRLDGPYAVGLGGEVRTLVEGDIAAQQVT